MARVVTLRVASMENSPYSQSKVLETPPEVYPSGGTEDRDAHDERCWRERCHVLPNGMTYIPGVQFAQSIRDAAKMHPIPIPGQGGKALYTKHFAAGIMVPDTVAVDLGVHIKDVKCEKLHVPANGRPGGTSRVWRRFPRWDSWAGEFKLYILDDIINRKVFERVLETAGMLVGVGRFRPPNRGFYGRYTAEVVSWQEGI